MYPSLYARARGVSSEGAPICRDTVPSAFPVGPWHTEQKFWYSVSHAASILLGITGTEGAGGRGVLNGFFKPFAVVVFPVVHSADQSGSPPLTGTDPSGE